jgi:hypothetical protein
MNTKTVYTLFRDAIRDAKLDDTLARCPVVAVLAGPSVIIEAMVRKAEENSGIPMDWGFVGGRAMIRANGDGDKARAALLAVLPVALA